MLDTVQIKHYYQRRLNAEQLRAIGAERKRGGSYPVWLINPEKSNPLPRLTFLFPDDGLMHISAEVSVPGFFRGHNARLLTAPEVSEAIEQIGKYVRERTVQKFNPETAIVSVIHFAKDIQLGEPGVRDAINRLSRLKLKGLVKWVCADGTLYFKSKSKVIRIYPKLNEVLANRKKNVEAIKAARGNLRFEYCLLTKGKIVSEAKKIGFIGGTVGSLLKQEVSDSLFLRLFTELQFPDLLTNDKSNLEILKEHYSGRKSMTLDGFLDTIEHYGEVFYKDPIHGFTRSAYYRAARDCKKAGVWRTGQKAFCE